MRGEMVFSRPMTAAERQRRSRSLRRSREAEPSTGNGAELDVHDEAVVYTFTDAELDEILAENDLLPLLREMREKQRGWLQRISEQLAELNLRLRIQRDPFQAMTIEGTRLRQKDEAERKTPAATASARKGRRLP